MAVLFRIYWAGLCVGFCLAASPSAPAAPAAPPVVTPYAQKAPLKIQSVSLSSATLGRYGRLEITVELSATFDNPFDPSDIEIGARLNTPSGKTNFAAGFFYRPFRRELKNGREVLTPDGPPSWRIRFTPEETGDYKGVVRVRDRSGPLESSLFHFTAILSESPGFVRVSPADRRYFAFDNGKSYFPIGADVCWGSGRGTFDYDAWFARYSDAGCNYARLWLSPLWTTFALEQPGKPEEGKGLGQFDLANAWRLDYVLETAATRGIYLMLCIDSYNVLREKDGYPQWDKTPHNAAQGGPLQHPAEFWTSAPMAQLYRDKLRYLAARYGPSPFVLSWEFWNEVDLTTGYRTAPVRAWHAQMATTMRSLDPHHHLLTTSFSNTRGDKDIDLLHMLDYSQTHHYNSPDLAVTVAKAQTQKSAYGKPHIIGEIGADSGGPRSNEDPEGLQIHDPLWASLATGGSGAAQPWWWDNYIHPRNLYPLFGALSRFIAGIDWPAENFRPVTPKLDWQSRPDPLPRADVVLKSGPAGWNPSEFNRPRHVKLTRSGAQGELPLAGIQHGVGGHRALHNPITFDTDLPWPTRFDVEVGDVSGYGGAALKVTLDGLPALTKEFADPDEFKSTETLKQYTGVYGIEIPAGPHKVVVENTGPDWFMAGYRFRNAIEPTGPPLLSWALIGTNTVIAWARVEDRTWQRVCALKIPVPPAPASVLTLTGLVPGRWKAELWDTWKGSVTETKTITVSATGEAHVALPAMEKDVAVKLKREP